MDKTALERITVPARGSFQHAVAFPEHAVPAVLSWSFSTEGKNIRFGLFKRAAGYGSTNSVSGNAVNGVDSGNGFATGNTSQYASSANSTVPSVAGSAPGLVGPVASDSRRSSLAGSKLGQMLGQSPRAFSFPSGSPTENGVNPASRFSPAHARSTSAGFLEARLSPLEQMKPLPARPPSNNDGSGTSIANGLPPRSSSSQDLVSLESGSMRPRTFSNVSAHSPSPPLPLSVLHSKALSSSLLTESGLVQLLPISHFESSKLVVKGSWTVYEPGEYVLYFDNSFSVQTPKKLTYFVSVTGRDEAQAFVSNTVTLLEGWISKKRAKKMQGWAKRWFRLLSDGTLDYSERKGAEVRGSVKLDSAVISLDAKKWRIDVDSEITLFHLKCFSEADYQTWAVALENFEPEGTMGAVDDVGIPIVNHEFQPTSPTQDSMASDAVSSLNGFAALRVSPLTPLFPSDSEQPYDIVKREIMRLSDVAGRAPPDLVPTLRSIQASLQRAAESLLLHNNSAPMHVNIGSLGRLRGRRAASILSAATGLSGEERWFDADEGESDEHSNYGSEEDAEAETASGTGSGSGSASAVEQQPLEPVPETLDIAEAPQPVVQSPIPVRPLRPRRTVLPVPGPCESPVSIMSILRQNMGKDLSTVSMPIGLNEPLSALQRLAEEFEYAPLLAKAVQLANPLERLALVSAFAVSGYASTLMRAGRKPFNPLLGETFELVMPERGARFLAEKVCHHPPILAYKGESMSEQGGWEVWGDQQVKSKFWGKTMEFLAVGSPVHVVLKLPGGGSEHYTFNRLTSCMRNLIGGGTRYLEHIGELRVQNHTTGQVCSLTFKEQGYFGSAKNEVTGHVKDETGREAMKLSGRWDEFISREHTTGSVTKSRPEMLEVLWRPEPFPPAAAQKTYGFTGFAIGLNDIHPELESILPRTDSRLRPDQRLFEEGQFERAEAEKARLENKQREARKDGREATPKWFQPSEDAHRRDEGRSWTYTGGYWEARDSGRWPAELPDIF